MAQSTRSATDSGPPAALERARRVSRAMDESIGIPGTRFRFGLDPLLGVVPYLGDSIASVVSLYVVYVGVKFGLPRRTLAKMVAFVAIDFLVGSTPVVGPVIDAVLKVNKRNVATLEAHLDADAV